MAVDEMDFGDFLAEKTRHAQSAVHGLCESDAPTHVTTRLNGPQGIAMMSPGRIEWLYHVVLYPLKVIPIQYIHTYTYVINYNHMANHIYVYIIYIYMCVCVRVCAYYIYIYIYTIFNPDIYIYSP